MEHQTPPSSPAPPPNPAPVPSSAERNWCLWCHLSALAGYIIPLGTILGPLIVWQMKRTEFPSVDYHGREALNFQISVLIYILSTAMAALVGTFFCIGWLLIPVVCAIPVVSLVLTIIAGIKAGDGVPYRYPFTIRLVK